MVHSNCHCPSRFASIITLLGVVLGIVASILAIWLAYLQWPQ